MRVAPKSVLSSGWKRFVDHDWTIIPAKSPLKPWSVQPSYCAFPAIPNHCEKGFDNIAAWLTASSNGKQYSGPRSTSDLPVRTKPLVRRIESSGVARGVEWR